MENKDFDDIIKEKLEALNSDAPEGSWDVFKEKWDDQNSGQDIEGEDDVNDAFDEQIKFNLQNFRVPFNSEHWIQLKAQLEAAALFRKKLSVAKTVEILALLLLVISVFNLMPIKEDIYTIAIDSPSMVDQIQVSKQTAQNIITNQGVENPIDVRKNNIPIVNKRQQNVAPIDKNIIKNEVLDFFNEQKENTAPESINSEQDDDNKTSNNGFAVLDDVSFDHIATTDVEKIDIPVRPIGFPVIALSNKKKKERESSFVSLGFGPRVNLVNSPFDPVYKIDSYFTFNTNVSIEARYGREIGPVEVYSGLGYSRISYDPLRIQETYRNENTEIARTSLDFIQFETFNIPLGVKYNFVDREKYKLYALASADVNLIGRATYGVSDETIGSKSLIFNPAPTSFHGSANENVNKNSALSQKDFNPGLFDGGSLGDNLYSSATFGIGFNKMVSDHLGIFIEPRYTHFISSNGLGPNSDKLHGVSVDLGVRYEIN